MDMRPSVLLIGGSLARPSHTGALLGVLEHTFTSIGACAVRWDVSEMRLPPFEPRGRSHAALRLVQLAKAADGLVIASPVYHGSFSAAVKNALEYLSAGDLEGKPVGLVSNGATPTPQAVEQLRLVVQALGGVAVPTRVVTCDADFTAPRPGYVQPSAGVTKRLDELVWEVTSSAGALVTPLADRFPVIASSGRTEEGETWP
jgi:NAD(P)H-dependent FMN reductase